MNKHYYRFWIILIIVFVSILFNLPPAIKATTQVFGRDIKLDIKRPELNLKLGNLTFYRDLNLKLGLDLSGGTQVLLQADMGQISTENRSDALTAVKDIITRRVDLFGVSEPVVRTQQFGDNYQIIVELPGLTNPQEALDLIGKTAQLKFKTPIYLEPPADSTASAQLVDFADTDLTGSDLKKAQVSFDQQTSQPVVSLEFNSEGSDKFAQLTREYLNKPIAIFLDDQIVTAPVVQSEILTGQAQITGNFTTDEAKALSIQLNAGALPVPVEVVSQKTVQPTLGQASIDQSLRAGAVGIGIVIAFMSAFYGWLGVIASVGLVIYGLITITLYRLMPVTLTVPGIAGLLLSIGMAVDSNILIFERYKEEVASGKPWTAALELGFGRAWDSIRDANLSSLTTAFILFNPLNWPFLVTSGPVRGFALTLVLGIITSLFTGIFVTRTLLRLFYRGHNNSITNH